MYIEVIVPLALPFASLTYICDQQVSVGVRVVVEVGATKQVVGIVRQIDVAAPTRGELKAVKEVLDAVPLVGEIELRFLEWIAAYYLCSIGDTLRALLSPLFSAEIRQLDCRYLKPKKIKVDGVKQLLNVNLASRHKEKQPIPAPQFQLNQSVTLLHAKSKIDLVALVGSLTAEDSTVLVLAPSGEQAEQIFSGLEPFFDVALCSNTISMKRRAALAVDMAVGLAAQVVVGTRAALSLMYANLVGVIVVDEESFRYKSQQMVQLSVRDAALMLASMHHAKSVLISECPSVESYYNARYGTWQYIATEAPTAPLKSIVLEHGRDLISKYLKGRIADALERGRRVVLMQNRRGVASYIECSVCRHIPQCVNCSTSLTVHRHLLGCHYCGTALPIDERCEKCGAVMELRGRGTQRIEDQITELYSETKIIRIDSDSMTEHRGKIEQDWQIAVGTKMVIDTIDWSEVGVAAVLNVDNIISTPDFRASEEVFRIVSTMGARCRDVGAEIVVQSSQLGNADVDDALNFRYDPFYIRAIDDRRAALFPPHSRMIRLSFRGARMADVVGAARDAEAVLRPIFAHRLSPMHQPIVERQVGDHIIEMLLKIERGRSSVKAKELLRSNLAPIIRKAARSKVAISAQSDPL